MYSPLVFHLSFLLLLQFHQIFATLDENFDHLYAASNHGHDTGMANKEKRCFAAPPQWRTRQYPSILGSAHNPNHLQPSSLSRAAAINSCNACMQTFCKVDQPCNFCRQMCHNAPIRERSADGVLMASRIKPEDDRQGHVAEEQERYYTVGALSAGPRQQIVAKMLNIPTSVQLDRLIILAKNKSKNKAPVVPHPVVIDTAHVFTRNEGNPSELDLELHNVKGGDTSQGDLSKLTNQLNKELDAAIETKRHMLKDSHLTPQEVDKIIEHVVEQLNKKSPLQPGKDIVGANIENAGFETRIAEDEDDLESFKKKKKHGSKKHGIFSGDEEFVGDAEVANDGELLESTLPESHTDHAEFEDGEILGHKKFKKFGHKKGGGGHRGGYNSGGYNRENDNEENEEEEQLGQSYSGSGYSTGNQQNYRPQHMYHEYQNGNGQQGMYPESNAEYQGGGYTGYEQEQVEPESYHKENQYENQGYQGPINPEPQYEQEQYESMPQKTYPIPNEPIYTQQEQQHSTDYEPRPLSYHHRQELQTKPYVNYQPPYQPNSYNSPPQYFDHIDYPSKPLPTSQTYSEPNYRSAGKQSEKETVDASSMGKNKEPHEEANLKANWFESEYNKLRQWISDNVPHARTPKPEADESNDKDAIVDEFTKVIEHDLTAGQELSSSELKSLDKKIATIVRDNINSENPSVADKKSEKKLGLLEELVEEEAKSKEEGDSVLDKFKSRFPPKVEEHIDNLKHHLRTSLDSLKKDHDKNKFPLLELEYPRTTAKSEPEKKPLINLEHIVGDIQAMPNKLMEGAGKLAKMMNSKVEENVPKLGQRFDASSAEVKAEQPVANGEETVGTFLKGKKDKEEGGGGGEWHMIPYHEYPHYGPQEYRPQYHYGYNEYRDAAQQAEQTQQSGKTSGPQQRPSASARSDENGESPLQEVIEELQENLHLPKLPPLPSLLPLNRQAKPKPVVPQIHVNNVPFNGDFPQQDLRPTLPEIVPMQIPQFQQRSNPEPSSQFSHSPFVGAMPQQHGSVVPPPTINQARDFTQFGRLVPEAVHDMHKREVSTSEGKKRMYFVGDGIRLPLHMHKHADGTLHLSVDVQKLCKCNMTSCALHKAPVVEPTLGSAHEDISMDIGDVPLQMVPPHLDVPNDNADDDDMLRVRRSPRFNYYDAGQPAHDDESYDHISPMRKGLIESVEKKIEDFNTDMKEYYDNEAKIKQARSDNADVGGYLQKRVGLLGRIINWMKDLAFEE